MEYMLCSELGKAISQLSGGMHTFAYEAAPAISEFTFIFLASKKCGISYRTM